MSVSLTIPTWNPGKLSFRQGELHGMGTYYKGLLGGHCWCAMNRTKVSEAHSTTGLRGSPNGSVCPVQGLLLEGKPGTAGDGDCLLARSSDLFLAFIALSLSWGEFASGPIGRRQR
ncbi:hypothetical protein An16g01100 [Aspergillus niger]|uniref:Uncharacterized protein n=2 Tax=Aspergillus niger TaxID=5061 RepID=A2R6S3_ASPNC|nr:hypothetical protein An16g01100 [Aspergillus niger]CAK97705.1 hypothetical protein An16g01100 [Aspergillus niger]